MEDDAAPAAYQQGGPQLRPYNNQLALGPEWPGDAVNVYYQSWRYEGGRRRPSAIKAKYLRLEKFDCLGQLESYLIQLSGGYIDRDEYGEIKIPRIFYHHYREENTDGRKINSENWETFKRYTSSIYVMLS